MMTLIIGGSGSGKSAYAEAYIAAFAEGTGKYYLATMQAFDKEGQVKRERHQKMRRGKGFLTIEQPLSIHKALEKIKALEETVVGESSRDVQRMVLLECMSNLVANEMFTDETPKSGEKIVEKITREIKVLRRGVTHLVIVTNNVFEDGIAYDKTTVEYIRALGSINEKLADMADTVIEIVVGIPLMIKGEK